MEKKYKTIKIFVKISYAELSIKIWPRSNFIVKFHSNKMMPTTLCWLPLFVWDDCIVGNYQLEL